MTEHLYLSKRNAEIRRLRFKEGKKISQIVLKIRDDFPDMPITVSRVSQILRVPRGTKSKLS